MGDSSSTQTLKDLEISLRTNNIQWVLISFGTPLTVWHFGYDTGERCKVKQCDTFVASVADCWNWSIHGNFQLLGCTNFRLGNFMVYEFPVWLWIASTLVIHGYRWFPEHEIFKTQYTVLRIGGIFVPLEICRTWVFIVIRNLPIFLINVIYSLNLLFCLLLRWLSFYSIISIWWAC